MGRKSKAVELGLVELIVDKHNGGRNTIVYVTEEVNKYLEENGLHVRFSRESIRRVLKTHEEEVEDTKKAIEAAKAMAEIFRDSPGTELAESSLMVVTSLLTKELRQFDGFEFENPNDFINALTKVSETHLKLSNYRMKAIEELDKAKEKIKEELREAISTDQELLNRLYDIIDTVSI